MILRYYRTWYTRSYVTRVLYTRYHHHAVADGRSVFAGTAGLQHPCADNGKRRVTSPRWRLVRGDFIKRVFPCKKKTRLTAG